MRRKLSLRNRFIFTSYLSIVVSIVLISVVSYTLLSGNSRRFALQANQDIALQTKEKINMKLEELEATVRNIIYGTEMQRILTEQIKEPNRSYMVRTSVNRAISAAANSLYMMDNIAIFSSGGDMIGSMFEFESSKKAQQYGWYERAAASRGETLWLDDSIEKTGDNNGGHVSISGVKKIRSIYSSGSADMGGDLGHIYISLNLDSILNFGQAEYASAGMSVLIVNKDLQIIGGSEVGRYGQQLQAGLLNLRQNNHYVRLEDKQYLFTYMPVDAADGWYIICLTRKDHIQKHANMAIAICFAVSMVLMAVFWFLSIRNAETLSKPIELLEKNFEMVERGDFNIKIHGQTNIQEINSLFTRFHVMVYRLDNLIHEVYEAKIKEQKLIMDARQAQLQSLQMQINPHFLYNTLDSINWMALIQGNEEVSRMIIALGHLFRNNMNTSGIHTTVKEELESVKLYMYLELVRFEGRLQYEIESEDDVKDAVILKHILQPLVENSIKYGIEPYHIKGNIQISVLKVNDKLAITVMDNGRGMTDEKQKDIRSLWNEIGNNMDKAFSEAGKLNGSGVGIKNIMKRLYLLYGEEALFTIESSENEGTRTCITYPYSNHVVQKDSED